MSATLTRKEREKALRKDAILSAARVVFSEKGYSSATIDEIAFKAEFGKGTLYNYFEGGKEELLFTIIDEMYEQVYQLIKGHFDDDAIDRSSMRTQLHELILKLLTYYEERRDTFMILVKEVQRVLIDADEKARYFIEKRNRLISALEEPLARAMESGQLRRLPPRAVANILIGNIHGCQMHAFLEKSNGGTTACTANENAEFLTVMLLDGLLEDQS